MKNKTKGIILTSIPFICIITFAVILLNKDAIEVLFYIVLIFVVSFGFSSMIVYGANLFSKDNNA